MAKGHVYFKYPKELVYLLGGYSFKELFKNAPKPGGPNIFNMEHLFSM